MGKDLLQGAGLGLRRSILDDFCQLQQNEIDFLEITPENWMGLGGAYGRKLRELAGRYPMTCHGLSLNVGGPAPLDMKFIADLKKFIDACEFAYFSEHLSYCADDGHLYDLMPIPFTEEAVDYVARRIQQVQERLGRRVAIENVSYYAAPAQQLKEIDFINAVISRADCDLLLDVNNIYVNSVNHGYDPCGFIAALPAERIAYMHIAGHYRESESLVIDTHGAEVIDPVWSLLDFTYQTLGVKPTLLERDFNFPPINELLKEVNTIRDFQNKQRQKYAQFRV
jgi:uncharacterized protein (UPF0276 family)